MDYELMMNGNVKIGMQAPDFEAPCCDVVFCKKEKVLSLPGSPKEQFPLLWPGMFFESLKFVANSQDLFYSIEVHIQLYLQTAL